MPAEPLPQFCIVLTTFSKDEVGSRIVDALLSQKLAACVQVLPIRSHYEWKGTRVHEGEHLMLIKARRADFKRIEAAILGNHEYEVPEVISVPVDRGFGAYLGWMAGATRRASGKS